MNRYELEDEHTDLDVQDVLKEEAADKFFRSLDRKPWNPDTDKGYTDEFPPPPF